MIEEFQRYPDVHFQLLNVRLSLCYLFENVYLHFEKGDVEQWIVHLFDLLNVMG
uniref:Uncharacterized protein n=1 Tax=Arcella intermedia TaxID=1963864 RepID=A0A6B2LU98_9EUKA